MNLNTWFLGTIKTLHVRNAKKQTLSALCRHAVLRVMEITHPLVAHHPVVHPVQAATAVRVIDRLEKAQGSWPRAQGL